MTHERAPIANREPHHPARILCFHAAESSTQAFKALSQSISPRYEFVPVELHVQTAPFRESAVEAFSSACARLADATQRAAKGESFVLLGHGLGGVLAFAVARRLLAERRMAPRAILLSASTPPGIERPWGTPGCVPLDLPCALLVPSADPGAPPQLMARWSEHCLRVPLAYRVEGGHFGLLEDSPRSAHLIGLAIDDLMDERALRTHFFVRPFTSV